MNTQPFINQLLNHLVTDNPTVISITLDNKQRVCSINETGLRFFKRNQNAIVQAPFNTLFSNSETPDIQFTPDKNNTCQTTSNVVNNHLITWYCMFDNNQHQIIATIAPQNHHIENQFLQNIVNNVPHFIFWKNTDSIFLGCNKSFAEVAKLAQPNDIIGLSDFDMPWTEEQSHKYRDDDKAIIQSGNARLGYEETQTQADGSTKTLLVSKVPMRDLNDNTIGILGIYTDITQLKSIETNLAKAKRQAEQSDQAKSHFLAAVTHEFKTPLNGILGTLEVLRKAPLPNKERQLLYDIQEASRSLNTLVDDILDFSQIQSGSFHLKSTCFDLPKMIKTVFNQSQRRPKVSNINFKLELDPALPQYFLGDPTRIEQMINNLLSNAIKYTNQGEVKLIAQCIESTATSATISIEISDTGIGIEETQQEHIFDRFTQINVDQHYYHNGVGLGLAIFKQLAQTMNARYGIQSKINVGTTFWFEITLPTAKQQREPEPPTPTLRHTQFSANILIIEDNALNQKVIASFLDQLGYQHSAAIDGQSGLEAMQGANYDAILLDLGLPDIDGFEVAKKIRQFDTQIPIILLTAYSLDSDEIDTTLISKFIPKPVSFNTLGNVLADLFSTNEDNPLA